MGVKENESIYSSNDWSIVTELAKLGSGAIISEDALASLFSRCSTSVKRAIERGELPPSVRLFGKPCWTVGTLIAHIEMRLENAKMDMENERRRIEVLCP